MKRIATKTQIVNPRPSGTIGSFKTTKVFLEILGWNHVVKVNHHSDGVNEAETSHSVEISFRYMDEDGEVIPSKNSVFKRSGQSIDDMYEGIKPNIDLQLTYRLQFEEEIIEGAKLQMVSDMNPNHGTTYTDVEEII